METQHCYRGQACLNTGVLMPTNPESIYFVCETNQYFPGISARLACHCKHLNVKVARKPTFPT